MFRKGGIKNNNKNGVIKIPKVSKSLLAFFLVLQVHYGMNFGFFKYLSKRVQYFATGLSILMALAVLVIISVPVLKFNISHVSFHWHINALLHFVTYFVILYLTKYNLYDFLVEASEKNNALKPERVGIAVFVYIAIIYMIKYASSTALCIHVQDLRCNEVFHIPYYFHFYGPAAFSLDSISVIFIILNYILYCAVKEFKNFIEDSRDIQAIRKYYLDVVETYDKITPLYDKLMTAELFFSIPKMMILIYMALYFWKSEFHWIASTNELVFAAHTMIRITIPSVMTEMVNHQMETAKRILHYQLLNNEDLEKLRLLRYMAAHKCEHKIWRIVPVDMRLPIGVLNMCVTYLIVIVQFTHLYN